jgi:hypothetical protein
LHGCKRDAGNAANIPTPLTTIKGILIMASKNLSQHEQQLKRLETSIREICDDHKKISDLVHESWTKSMQLFVMTDDLRTSRLEFEKHAQES